MPQWSKEGVGFAKEVVHEFRDDDCLTMAAALAYYTVFSLAPVLVIVIVVAGLFVTPERASEAVHGEFRGLIGADGADQIRSMVEGVQADPSGTMVARILGVIAVLIGSNGVMLQLQTALNRAWNVKPDPRLGGRNFLMKRLMSFATILVLALLLLVSLVATAGLTAIATRASWLLPAGVTWAYAEGINFGVSLVVMTGLLAAIYKVMPEARIRWRDVAVGSAVTGVLFTIGKVVFGIYLGRSNIGQPTGPRAASRSCWFGSITRGMRIRLLAVLTTLR